MDKHLQIIDDITKLLASVGLSTPIVFGAIISISAIIKALTGSGPTVAELADRMQGQLAENDPAIKTEIDRLKAKLNAQG